MIFKKKILTGLILAVLVQGVFANQIKTVKVGYYENEIFQEGAKSGAVRSGYAYEYYRKLSEYSNWKFEYVYGDFAEIYQQFIAGQVDLIAGISYTKDRTEQMYFPESPMGSTSYYMLRRSSGNDTNYLPSEVNNKKIGCINSAIVDITKNWMEENNVHAQLKTYNSYDEMYLAFDINEIDFMVVEGVGTYARKGSEVFLEVGKSDFYLCVSKYRPDLLEDLNKAQQELKTEEPSYLNLLYTKYYSKTLSSKTLSVREQQWFEEHSTLTVGYLNNYLPYSDTDASGQVTGLINHLVPEMLKNFEATAGITLKYKGYDSFSDMLVDLNRDVIDLAFPVGGSMYYLEELGVNQSEPVASTNVGIVHKKNAQTIEKKVYAINKNNRMQYFFARTYFPDASLKFYDSIDDCLWAIKKGEADYTTVNGLRVNSILKNSKYRDLDYVFANQNDERAFGVKIGDEALLKFVNRSLNSIDSDFIDNNVQQYAEELYVATFGDFIRNNIFIIIIAGFIIVSIMVVFFLRDLKHKREYLKTLEDKNEELRKAKENSERYLTDMLRFASSESDPDKILNQLLKYIGTNIISDRVYIFERNSSGGFDNTYEWCKDGIEPQIDMLQDIPYEGVMDLWINEFSKTNRIIIKNLEAYKSESIEIYNILKPQNINTLVAGPIYIKGQIIGFLGVDNPPVTNVESISSFFNLIEFVFSMMIRMRNTTRFIEDNAVHDQLTGCKNRKGLKWAFECEYEQQKSMAIFSFDMNGLKKINDTQGHEAGDNFICSIANSLSSIFGKENVYRMGGDEFVSVLTGISNSEYENLLQRCELQIGNTASLGTVYTEKVEVTFKELLKQADFAMYKDKDKFYQDKRRYRE